MKPRSRFSARLLLPALLLGALLGLAACDSTEAEQPAEATVMSYNVYLGFDIFTLLEAEGLDQALARAAASYQTLLATDFAARAEVLADQIEAAGPALVGLQEVALYRIQDGTDLPDFTPNADSTLIDFLAVLQEALAARGLDYRVAASVTNADVELPVDTNPNTPVQFAELQDVRLTDRDVILARGDVETSEARTSNYEAAAAFTVAGSVPVELTRGYAQVTATLGDQRFTFVNTHVEGLMPAHEAQIGELAAAMQAIDGPLVLAGDLNTPADGSGPPGYGVLVEDGPFRDALAEAGDGPGLTCCVGEDLVGGAFENSRIDFVLVRGAVEAEAARIVGNALEDKTPGGLWPSDHAGVVVRLRIGG